MTPEALKHLLGLMLLIQIVTFVVISALFVLQNMRMRPKKTKKVVIDDNAMYNTINTLLEYCTQKKDNEGAMLVTAFGKHLYDKRLKK